MAGEQRVLKVVRAKKYAHLPITLIKHRLLRLGMQPTSAALVHRASPVGRSRVHGTEKACSPSQRSSSAPPSAPKTRGTGAPMKKRQPRISRNCHLTQSERVQLAMEYQALPKDTRGRRIGVAKLCKRYHVCPSYVTDTDLIVKIMGAANLGVPAHRKKRCDAGVPMK